MQEDLIILQRMNEFGLRKRNVSQTKGLKASVSLFNFSVHSFLSKALRY